MNSHELNATVESDGTLVLHNLPFAAGESVHIVIVPIKTSSPRLPWQSLEGTLVKYDDPFEPAVPPDDWEAYQ